MLIAILADTHDNARTTRAAIELVRPRGVGAWLHCGDMCAPAMLDLFAGLPLWFVFGNNDFDRAGLQAAGAAMGAKCLGAFGDVTLAGKRIALFHGDDFVRRQRWVDSGVYDYALSGHTHKRLDGRRGRTREINPGALHRAAEKTVALLDLASDKLEFLTVEAGGSY